MLDAISIDAAVVNLCIARGMDVESAARMLAMMARAHRPEASMPGWRSNPCNEIEIVRADDARIHAARRRICRIEKEIEIACRGEESSLSRKKWRRDQGDAESIAATLAHVLSRPAPKGEADITGDARILLYRTGDAEYPRQPWNAPPAAWDGSPGLNFALDRSAFTLGSMSSGTMKVEGQAAGRITITMEGAMPSAAFAALEAAEGRPAREVMEWKALDGWKPYTIEQVYKSCWKDEESVKIVISAPRLVCSKKTGAIVTETKRWTRMAA